MKIHSISIFFFQNSHVTHFFHFIFTNRLFSITRQPVSRIFHIRRRFLYVGQSWINVMEKIISILLVLMKTASVSVGFILFGLEFSASRSDKWHYSGSNEYANGTNIKVWLDGSGQLWIILPNSYAVSTSIYSRLYRFCRTWTAIKINWGIYDFLPCNQIHDAMNDERNCWKKMQKNLRLTIALSIHT